MTFPGKSVGESRRREKRFAAAERDYRRLEADPEALAEYEVEIALWDASVGDGLPKECWLPDDTSNSEP